MGWILTVEEKLLPCAKEHSTPVLSIIMNIVVWNCKGTLKPGFQDHVRELVHNHNPAIFMVMETKVGGAKAKEIIDKLPFDGAIHTDTIGYASGLWFL